jgi:Undecaprenyl-phosphate glucose phosphotransferase
MSVSMDTLSRAQGARRAPAALSQGIIEGLVGVLDAVAVCASGLVLLKLLSDGPIGVQRDELAVVVLFTVLMVLGLHAAGAYSFRAIMRPLRHAHSIVVVCGLAFMALTVLAFALKISADFSRVWTFSWVVASIVVVLLLRLIVASSLHRLAAEGHIERKIVIFGAGDHGRRIIEHIEQLDEPWNRIVGVFDDRLSRIDDAVGRGRYPVLGNLSDLVAWCRHDRTDEVLIALPWGAEERLVTVLKQLSVLPANVRLCSEFSRMELIHGRASSQFGIPMLNAYEKPVAGWGRIVKRLFDVSFAGTALILSSPLLALIAIAIKLESPGPVLFRQQRFGFNNRLIEVLKFRTMLTTMADPLGERLTERDDPRLTRLGALLRRWSLDEMPQLINVIRSEMSVVGPRPHAIRTTAGGRQCDQIVDQYAIRHKVKPGITGWAQVNGWRGTMEEEEHLIRRLDHDLHYINNWSLALDLRILIRTVWIVIGGRNSF